MPSVASTNERPNSPGVLISFEGLDGVGKTTQIGLVENALHAQGRETLRLREPGATRLGEAVRELLLDKQDLDISPMAELLLFEAARAQLVESVIRPALERGCVVLCDRFYDSTIAYQGHGRRLGTDLVHKANVLACGELEPDRTLVLDMDLVPAHKGPTAWSVSPTTSMSACARDSCSLQTTKRNACVSWMPLEACSKYGGAFAML